MTYNLYAVTVAAIALGVICIYCAAYVVISADPHTWKCDREAKARIVTYWLSLIIAGFVFTMMYLV